MRLRLTKTQTLAQHKEAWAMAHRKGLERENSELKTIEMKRQKQHLRLVST